MDIQDHMEEAKLRPDEGELVEITIDGEKFTAPKGGNLLKFMLSQGIEISYFCYHPGLSVVAVCRQCLVELKGMAKLVPACQTPIRAGMAVLNASDKVREARRQLLEFTLLNHPVDCPVCDKAGECILQKQYMEVDHQERRSDVPKVHKPKAQLIGPRVMLDDERCILCSRCVRFMREVAREPQLVIARRGNHSVLTTAPGTALDHPYALNVVDICPVGALTDKDFRFKIRVWDLSYTYSVCNGCATGCPVEVHHHQGKVYRLVPRRRQSIDLNWMCDYGRYSYKSLVSDDRQKHPRLGGKDVGWGEALAAVGKALATRAEAGKGARVGVVLGADATNEDNYVAAELALDSLEGARLYLGAEPDGEGDDLLRAADPNPNRRGAEACGRGKARSSSQLAADLDAGELEVLYVVGDAASLSPEAVSRAASLPLLVVQAAHPGALADKAGVLLPAAMWAEVDGTMINAKGEVQRLRAAVLPPGFARPHWQILAQAASAAGFTLEHVGPKAIFQKLSQEIDAVRGSQWGRDLPPGLLRYHGSRG